jgi:pimeloyl-ACP methyl ester carboxylesterase
LVTRLAPALLVLCACAAPAKRPPTFDDVPDSVTARQRNQIDPAGKLAVASEAITFAGTFGGSIPGTLVRPAAPGRWPAIVLMAGSGPTDRDWNSPLMPGKNGSAALLADALARHGVIVLRFDKAGVGANKVALEQITLDTYRDEGRAALAYLRTRAEVDTGHLFVAGHSEGGIHAIRVAQAEGNALAGLVLLSSAGRTMEDILLGQIDAQFRTAVTAGSATRELADREMRSLRTALSDFLAGETIDPKRASTIPAIQQLVAIFTLPQTAALLRTLLAFDPAPALAEVSVPVFIYNGKKDIQVDPDLDAGRLESVRRDAQKDVSTFLAPDANHVLELEPRALAELRAGAPVNYNAADRTLDPATVQAIVDWLVSSSRS